MDLPITEHRVRVAGHAYRILRVRRLGRAVLWEHPEFVEIRVDRTAASRLGSAWLLAARSRRSLVHVPIPAAESAVPDPPGEARAADAVLPPVGAEPDDAAAADDVHVRAATGAGLLLVHHSAQFPASRWKAVRARLGAGEPHRVALRPADFDREARRAEAAPRRGGPRRPGRRGGPYGDRIREETAAGTVVLTGSVAAFGAFSESLLALARHSAHEEARMRAKGLHHCAELVPHGGWLAPRARSLHVVLVIPGAKEAESGPNRPCPPRS